VHLHGGRADLFTSSDGLSAEDVYNIFEDREGNIWVATINGLDRFREFSVATLTTKQGLSNDLVFSVLADRDGSVWLANRGGLNRWNDGQMTRYRGHAAPPKAGVREVVGSGVPDEGLASLFQDDRGRVWVSTLRGVGYMEDARFSFVSGLSDGVINYMAQDGAGTMWFGDERLGLYQLPRGGELRHVPWAALGHQDPASAFAGDPSRGGLWLGFNLGGVAYFADDQVRASYAAADGLGGGRVNHLRLDPEGALWVAADGGLSRLNNGRAATLNGRNGLPCDTVHWSMEDDARTLWLYTACGLLRVARPELDAWAASVDRGEAAKPAIRPTVFDSSDGVRILAGAGHYSPQVAKSSDGRLWFLPFDGASVFDPNRLPFNRLPPPVHVEQIIADRKTYDATPEAGGRLRLPPLIRDLEVDYTALSLAAPEKVQFRYKLEGRDADWQDAGGRRQAFYSDLPPGDYRFRVMACNNSGVWNEAGTFLDFSVAPAYYQTAWFRLSYVAAFLLLLGGLYQLRVRQVSRQLRGRMEERHAERERIARDLHDTLLQSVQGLILKFHAVATQMRGDDPAYGALEKTLDQADEVLAEGRDRIRNLRGGSVTFGGLPAAFQRVVEETPQQGGGVAFKTVVEGSVRELHPIIREESYCIGREALVNALKHSEGRNVEVEITYDPRQFRLRVRDDGRGIDPAIIEEGRPDHWGLRGMRERAQRIGAQLNLWSRSETGTEVELTVPGATAYQAPGAGRKRFWPRRSNGAD